MRITLKCKRAAITVAFLTIILSSYLTACGKDQHVMDSEILVSDVASVADDSEIISNSFGLLNVPTQINKIGDDYFIVDCYNNQVIYSDSLERPLYEWSVMTRDINKGHTVAGDGTVYLVDDTDNNRVLVFEKYQDKFVNTQVLNDIGNRPHYIVYNEKNQTFYVWSSLTGQMYLMKRNDSDNRVYVSEILEIEELNGVYVRSFTIVDNDIYFVSGNCQIIKAKLKNFKITGRYVVPVELAGMIQIMPVDNQYLITISTDANGSQAFATIIQTDSLEKLYEGDYTDVYDQNFIGGGTPYYMSEIDGLYYLTEHRVPGHSLWSFEFDNGSITNVKAIY